MINTILMVYPGAIEQLPPLVTVSTAMSAQQNKVYIACASVHEDMEKLLIKNNVFILKMLEKSQGRFRSKIKRIYHRLIFIWHLARCVLKVKPRVIWYHGMEAMDYHYIMKCFLFFVSYDVISQAHEMNETNPIKNIIPYSVFRKSKIVLVPEINRLWMIKIGSKSSAKFILIPNIPSEVLIPSGKSITKKIFRENNGLPTCEEYLIYQGIIQPDRCLENLIDAFKIISDDKLGLIILGDELNINCKKALIKRAITDKRIVFLDHINPPKHLLITKGCLAGILLYKDNSLNNIYCAPNKIYEYAVCGLPMLLPNYPGMEFINEKYNLGITCNPQSIKSIKEAIVLLSKNKKNYKKNLRKFLKKEGDVKKTYKNLDNFMKNELAITQ